MRTPVERKEAARNWQQKHAGLGQRSKTFAFRNDDQDKIIPNRGPRGRGRLSAFFSFPRTEAVKIVVNDTPVDFTVMPVILDTNVVVAGLFSLRTGSASRQLMEWALADGGKIVPCVTSAIVYEYKRILEKFGDDRLEQFYRLLSRSIEIPILPDIESPPVEADPFDTPFVQALVLTMRGLEGNQRPPSRLVTWDIHLLNMVNEEDSAELLNGRIVTPRDILRELRR
jgi:predicted nucleic acid-binding protein